MELDIHSQSADPKAARLSTFTSRHFVYDGVVCASLESFVQSLVTKDQEEQNAVCSMSGLEANRWGQEREDWQRTQVLWWRGEAYGRISMAIDTLLRRAYYAAYDQDPSFKVDLLAITGEELTHSTGLSDPCFTLLTGEEYLSLLVPVKIKALEENLFN